MRLRKPIWFLLSWLVVTLFTEAAAALPVGDKSLHASVYDVTFSIASGSTQVDCEVYKYTTGDYAGKYAYTYQISNIDSGIGLSFFSVAILAGANAFDPDFDELSGGISPAAWAVVESPAQSVDALFSTTIDDTSASTILWFFSDHAATSGNGALFGTSAGIPYYATGELLTPTAPMPEPATLVILGIGWLMTLTRRRRSA